MVEVTGAVWNGRAVRVLDERRDNVLGIAVGGFLIAPVAVPRRCQ